MISIKYQTVAPYLRDKVRLVALGSGFPYDSGDRDPEHILRKLDTFVGKLDDQRMYELYDIIRDRPLVDRDSVRLAENSDSKSDILLKDIARQHKGLEERFRKKLFNVHSMDQLADGSTRFHLSCSRGFERDLVMSLIRLESEILDRKYLRPVI